MTSRHWFDLVKIVNQLQELRAQSADPLFTRKFFTAEGVYEYAGRDPSEALRVEERIQKSTSYRDTRVEGKAAVPFTSLVPTSLLCDACETIVANWPGWKHLRDEHTVMQQCTFEELCESANRGCQFCHLRMRALENYGTHVLEKIRSCTYRFWVWESNDSIYRMGGVLSTYGVDFKYTSLTGEVLCDRAGLQLCEAEAWVDSTIEDKVGPSDVGEPIPLPWETIHKWLDDCENTHCFCTTKEKRGSFLPTRLIRLPEGPKADTVLSVVSTTELPRDTRYATLSHCWGHSAYHQFIKTCSEEYFEAIYVRDIPQLFQDAIAIVQRLGLQYIWIDCFCIKQGSNEDWISESAKMDRVYQTSFINLAASKSDCSDESMFYTRSPFDVKPCIIQTKWDCDDSGNAKRWMVYKPELLDRLNFMQGALAQRAWVAQELVLAPRILHLGSSQVFWECDTLRACETYPLGIPSQSVTKQSVNPISLRYKIGRGTNYDSYKYQIWADLVNIYSARKLTKVATDKLVAISGLAKAIGAPVDSYLAGLWKEDLGYQLLWERQGMGTRAPPAGELFQAPSWSWASFNGPVSYRLRESNNDPQAELLIKIVDSRTEKLDRDPTGRVEGGYVHIEAPLAISSVDPRPRGPNSQMNDMSFLNGCSGRYTIDDLEALKAEHTRTGGLTYLMPAEIKTEKGDPHTLVVGLVLLGPQNEQQNNNFQRVGYFTVTNSFDQGEIVEFWKSFRASHTRPPPHIVATPSATWTAPAITFDLPLYSFTII